MIENCQFLSTNKYLCHLLPTNLKDRNDVANITDMTHLTDKSATSFNFCKFMPAFVDLYDWFY